MHSNERFVVVDADPAMALSFGQLLAHVNTPSVVSSIVSPTCLKALVLALTVRLVNNVPITLLDHRDEWPLASAPTHAVQTDERRYPCHRHIMDFDALKAAIATSNATIGIFTSGTTGQPKLVAHTVKNLARTVRQAPDYAHNVWGFAYSYTHMAGMQVFFQAILNGNSMVDLFEKSRLDVLRSIEQFGITHLSATPSFFRLLLPISQAIPGVKKISMGGEKAAPALLAQMATLFVQAKINNIYASTEAGALLHGHGEWFSVPAALQQHIKIVNDELQIHESLLGTSTALKLVAGWYATGDLVEQKPDDGTQFRFVARQSDVVNVGGNKVNPNEVEAVLTGIEGVAGARVYAKANSVLGQVLVAEVVALDNRLSEQRIREVLTQKLQAFKLPRKINFVDRLPLTRTGKTKRT
jgi:acyl-coenzyme A synthetase/AMP-(fatty) acid ligase